MTFLIQKAKDTTTIPYSIPYINQLNFIIQSDPFISISVSFSSYLSISISIHSDRFSLVARWRWRERAKWDRTVEEEAGRGIPSQQGCRGGGAWCGGGGTEGGGKVAGSEKGGGGGGGGLEREHKAARLCVCLLCWRRKREERRRKEEKRGRKCAGERIEKGRDNVCRWRDYEWRDVTWRDVEASRCCWMRWPPPFTRCCHYFSSSVVVRCAPAGSRIRR